MSRYLIVEINIPLQHPADGQQKIARGLLFGDIAARAGPDDPFGVQRFVVHGHDQHQQPRPPRMDLFDQVQPVRVL